jgi:phage tail-like protein
VYSTEGDGAVSLANFRKDIYIEMLNLQGTVIRAYRVFRCWVSSYTAQPDLDANANAIAFETIILQNEGFERDEAVVEVAET